MKLSNIRPDSKIIGGILFFALITFLICFGRFQIGGQRPLSFFKSMSGKIVELNQNDGFIIDGGRAGYTYTDAFSLKFEGFREKLYNENQEYASRIDNSVNIEVWYYKPILQDYYLIKQIKQNATYLLPNYWNDGLINLIFLVLSFIVSVCCIYIRRRIKE